MIDETHADSIPPGYCQCGCGQKTSIAKRNRKSRGWIKGKPVPYAPGHNGMGNTLDDFWAKVAQGDPGECWEWQAGKTESGYGQFNLNNENRYAHRLSYEIHHGKIPAGLHVCHTCDNPACVNPRHLFLGTARDNVQDMWNKDRQYQQDFGRGQDHPQAKLRRGDVLKIRRLQREGITQTQIARQFGITQANVSCIVHRKTWRHL